MDDSKHSISISAKLHKEIKDYCSLNGLKINTFVEGLLRKAFNVEKFGEAPFVKFQETEPETKPTRVYPKEDMEREIEHFNDSIEKGEHYGEVEHPDKEEPVEVVEPPKEPEPVKSEPKKGKKITRLN